MEKSESDKLESDIQTRIIDSSSEDKKQILSGDASRLAFLIFIYMVQGASFGFLMRSLSVILNKNLSKTDVGIISFWSFPYNVKFLISPLVETKYFKFLGKRRSWIVPTLIISGLAMLYLSENIHFYIDNKWIYTLLFTFMIIFLCNAIQDISVDGWSVTMVKEENLSNAATSQMIGLRFGGFLSTSVYYALSSVEFCNQFIYSTNKAEPVLNEELFFKIWGLLVMLIAMYVLIFANEKNDTGVKNTFNCKRNVLK